MDNRDLAGDWMLALTVMFSAVAGDPDRLVAARTAHAAMSFNQCRCMSSSLRLKF